MKTTLNELNIPFIKDYSDGEYKCMEEEKLKNIKYWENYSNVDLILAFKDAKKDLFEKD